MGQKPTREQMEAYVRRWDRLGPLLDDIRDNEIRAADTPAAILMLNQAYQIAMRDLPPRSSSGLVEFQRYVQIWQQRIKQRG